MVETSSFASDRLPILNAAKQWFDSKKPDPFIPGKTYIPASQKIVDSDDLAHLLDASMDMWLTAGRYAKRFESEIAKIMGRNTSGLLVNSGSSANLLAVSSLCSPMMERLGMKPLEKADEVITVAAGFPTTVNPIIQNGLVPVFVDVDFDTLNTNLDLVADAKTSKTRAVILAHTLGNPFRADLISEWCKKNDLYFIEDCCDALGAHIDGSPVGSFGDYSTLSFYPAHHITMGEGGAVTAKDGRLKRVAESLRDWGRDCWCDPGKDNTCGQRFNQKNDPLPCGYDHKYTYSSIGYNLKATDMQAAIGLSQLNKLDSFVRKRNNNWTSFRLAFLDRSELDEKFTLVEPTFETEPSWFGIPIHCNSGVDRNSIISYLESHGVGTRLPFGGNLTKQPAYKNAHYRIHGDLRNTDKIMNRTFWIGAHPGIDWVRHNYMVSTLIGASKSL